MLKILITLLGFVLSTQALAQIKYVQDSLGILTNTEKQQLSSYLAKQKKNIIVVIKYSENIEDDTLNFGRGPNSADIVVWYSPKHKDQTSKVRIEISSKLEGDIPDIDTKFIVTDNLSLLRNKQYYQFFHKVSESLSQKIDKTLDSNSSESNVLINWWWVMVLIMVWLTLAMFNLELAINLLFYIPMMLLTKGFSGDFSGGGSTSED